LNDDCQKASDNQLKTVNINLKNYVLDYTKPMLPRGVVRMALDQLIMLEKNQ